MGLQVGRLFGLLLFAASFRRLAEFAGWRLFFHSYLAIVRGLRRNTYISPFALLRRNTVMVRVRGALPRT